MQTVRSDPEPSESDDEVFGGLNALTKLLRDLDDRGLVLSLAAFSEQALGDLLNAFMLPSEATKQLINGFNAPLGTFSSRIKAAYVIGLLTKKQFLDLESLRKIRNEFAHTWKEIDLSTQKNAALVDGMSFSRIEDEYPCDHREKLRSSMSCLLVEIRALTHQIQKKGLRAKLIGWHLMCGFAGGVDAQIQSARSELEKIVNNLEGAREKKREFYLTLLLGLKDRLTALAKPENPEQEKSYFGLLASYEHAVQAHLDSKS